MFSETVTGHEARRFEARRREMRRERAQRFRANRLGPASSDPPARKIQCLDLRALHPAKTQLVSEVRRKRNRAPIGGDRIQPDRRAFQKEDRRHDDQIDAAVDGGDQHADEPHVVIERQPAHADVVGLEVQPVRNGRGVGVDVGVRQHDALGRGR